MNYFFKVLGVCAIVICLNACNTNDDIACEKYTGALNANETPLVGTWRLTAVVSDKEVDITDDSEDNATTDIFAQYTDCQKDAEYMFTAERSYTFKQSFTALNCLNKSDNDGTWRLNNNLAEFASNCAQYSVNINLDANETVFTFESNVTVIDVNDLSISAKFTYTYTKI